MPLFMYMNYHVTTGVSTLCLVIPIDSLSISLGMGLSITLKAGVKLPGWLSGAIADQWPEQSWRSWVQFPVAVLDFFLFQLAYNY